MVTHYRLIASAAAVDGIGDKGSRNFPVTVQPPCTPGAERLPFLNLVNITVNGTGQGDVLTFTMPDKSGRLDALAYKRGTEADFNKTLAAWQHDLTDAYQARASAERAAQEAQAAAERAAQAVRDRASELANAISSINASKQSITGKLVQLRSVLANESRALNDLRSSLKDIQQKAAVRPMTQYQACSTVTYVYSSTMTYQLESSLGYQHNQFRETRTALDKELAGASGRVAGARAAAQALQAAQSASSTPQRLSAKVGDEQAPVAAYLAGVDAVGAELAKLQATDVDNLATAQDAMRQGKAAMDGATAQVKC